MITKSKALDQDVSANTKSGWKEIPYMYKKILFAMNPEDREAPADEISTQRIEIFDINIDTEAHSLLELGLKRQGIYYVSLQIANVKQIARGAWSCPSELVPGGVSRIVIHTWNPLSNYQAHNALVLSLKTTHQMDNSAIKSCQNLILSCPEHKKNVSVI